ncbi:LDCC motif putative metal-binding protein [Geosporobacter ferrireducens]|nr:LDCC motif putative metal-binding protein [Geosporobacter ferrireducens]
MKKWFKNFLKKLEEVNQKNFGSKRLDCCNVNQKSSQSKPSKQ